MEKVPVVTEDKLVQAIGSVKVGKAPGSGGVPAEVIREVAMERFEILLDMYNACLAEDIFSK